MRSLPMWPIGAPRPALIAVISVGPNSYGHPDEGVLAALTEAGARVLTTWEQGDIAIQLR